MALKTEDIVKAKFKIQNKWFETEEEELDIAINVIEYLMEENKKLKEKNQAWKQVVDWATECDFNLEQIIQDEDELDSFIEEMEKKGMDYLDMFNEYAMKYLKERENNES